MKMEKYATFDDFVSAQSEENQNLIAKLRNLVNKTAPELEESVKWGNGCWLNGDLPVIFIHCEEDYVQLGFFGGSKLDNPNNLLKGNAKYVRHIKIESEGDIKESAFSSIISQASTYNYKNAN